MVRVLRIKANTSDLDLVVTLRAQSKTRNKYLPRAAGGLTRGEVSEILTHVGEDVMRSIATSSYFGVPLTEQKVCR